MNTSSRATVLPDSQIFYLIIPNNTPNSIQPKLWAITMCIFQSGFTLLEVLVAVFVLSLALLGMFSFEVVSLRHHYLAYQKSVAATQLASMIQRIKANPSRLSEEILRWNEWNKRLLPDAQGGVSCTAKDCNIQINWFYHGKQSLSAVTLNPKKMAF